MILFNIRQTTVPWRANQPICCTGNTPNEKAVHSPSDARVRAVQDNTARSLRSPTNNGQFINCNVTRAATYPRIHVGDKDVRPQNEARGVVRSARMRGRGG